MNREADQLHSLPAELSEPPDFNVDPDLHFHNTLPLELLQMWLSRCPDDGLPARRDFDVLELKDFMGWLCVAEETADGEDFIYRLIGTRVVDNVGRDITGKAVSEALPPAALNIFRYIVQHPAPLRTWGTVNWRDRDYIYHEALLLPLADDHQRVNRFFVMMMFYDRVR
jgi:hypothetical protein